MLNKILTDKVLSNIKNHADDREIVMYGKHDELQKELEISGCTIRKVFTQNSLLLKENTGLINTTHLKGKSDRYYVVISHCLSDNGTSQRETMDKYGFEKYKDYIFYPNDEYLDEVFCNIKEHLNGREIVSYGYSPKTNEKFKEQGYEIKKIFSGNLKLINDKKLNCTDYREMKNMSDKYYVICPFFLNDGGMQQRRIMNSFGYKYAADYIFCQKQDCEQKIAADRFANNELAERLYIPDRYKDKWYEAFNKKYFSDRKVGVSTLENGVILPLITQNHTIYGGVCDENYNFVVGHLNHSSDGKRTGRICNAYIPDEEPEYIDETVVFGGVMFDHPGHLMYEMFCQRLWWHVQNPDSNLRIAVCYTWGDGTASFIKQFFELLNISEERILFIEKPMKFKKIIIPEQSMYPLKGDTPYDFTKEYVSVVEAMNKNIVPGKYKKIYLSKLKTIKQDIINEEYFVDYYKSKGFEIIDPEDYTIREKAEIMAGADEVVSNIGTNTLFVMFCKPDVKITLTTRVNDQIMDCQAMMHEVRGITDFYCVDVSLNLLHKNRIWGISLLGITDEWKRYAKDLYNDEIKETTEDVLRKNLYDYLKRCAEYYTSVGMMSKFTDYSHFEIINNLNEVFLGKSLNPEKYSNSPNDDQNELKKNNGTIEFFVNFALDSLFEHKFDAFLQDISGKSISFLCSDDNVTKLIKQVFESLDNEIIFYSAKSKLRDLNDKEWGICRNADIILSYDPLDYDPGRRDGVKAKNIWDIFRSNTNLTSFKIYHNISSIIPEIHTLQHKIDKKFQALTEEINKHQSLEQENIKLNLKLYELENKISDMENSRSWRITKPLRSIMQFLRRLFGRSKT